MSKTTIVKVRGRGVGGILSKTILLRFFHFGTLHLVFLI